MFYMYIYLQIKYNIPDVLWSYLVTFTSRVALRELIINHTSPHGSIVRWIQEEIGDILGVPKCILVDIAFAKSANNLIFLPRTYRAVFKTDSRTDRKGIHIGHGPRL